MKRMFAIFFVALAACSPKLVPPRIELPDRYIYAMVAEQGKETGVQWWKIFGDTVLDSYVERALAANRNISAAASRVEEARQARRSARAVYLPQVAANVQAEGSRTAAQGVVQSYTVEPSLSWEVSLFGALRSADRAARAEIEASKWALRGVELSLAAEVVTTYYTLAQYSQNLATSRESYRLRREAAALVDSMHRYGMADGISRMQAQSLVYTAAGDIARYEQSADDTWLTLCTLMGENPSPTQLAAISTRMPQSVPAALPSELLVRRPDILQAQYDMASAAAQAGAARAARFPSIALTARGGVAASDLKDLASGDPGAWQAVGAITEPIFAFGRLRASERAAVERYRQAAARYEQSVLEALSEVESALAAIESLAEQVAEVEALVATTGRIAAMTWARYRGGMTDYLDVLDAQRNLYTAQLQLATATAQQRINYATLFRALGGGWTNTDK